MSEINSSLRSTIIPSEAAEAIPTPSIDSRREKARRKELATQRNNKRNRTYKFQTKNRQALLQSTLPGKTPPRMCQSSDSCKVGTQVIVARYRVCIVGTQRRYFHPECFEDRFNVSSLIPGEHFKMEHPEMCGLMVHKWFENNRAVDLDAIAQYIMQDSLYRLGMLEPEQPMPELKNYMTEPEDRCSLKDLLNNVMCGCFRKKALALAG